jgi:3-oxoacyl-[acyl-carrier-protein] synthase-3
VLKSDGSGASLLYARGPAAAPDHLLESEAYFVNMDGREVFKFAVRAMEEIVRSSVALAGLTVNDLDFVIPHQANQRIIAAAAKSLGMPEERMVSNLDRYGNTSSASIPIALCEAWEQGRVHEGDRLMLVAFGSGLTWGAGVVEWTGLGSKLTAATK